MTKNFVSTTDTNTDLSKKNISLSKNGVSNVQVYPSRTRIDFAIENVQVYPTRTRIELNDKATKILFNIAPEYYAQMIQDNKGYGVIEKKNHKKHGKIKSSFHIFNERGYTVIIELNEFDRAVLSVCVSEWYAGNRYITIPMILRGLTGKVGESAGFRVYKDQLTAILQSIDKLMFTAYDPNIIDAFQKLNYDDGSIERITKSAILPCYRVEKTVNGKKSDVIYFDRESPLFHIASLKKQILTYDISLLDVPNQNNTPLIITLKNYSMRRIVEIKQHDLTPTLTLDDIFSKCRIKDEQRKIKEHVRKTLEVFFAHLQSNGFIKSFEWTKKGNKFYSIKFTY